MRAALLLSCMLLGRAAAAQVTPRDSADDERAYAIAIAAIADSAIHRLDFFQTQAQLRVQMAFTAGSRELATVPFAELSAMSAAAAVAIDEWTQQFTTVAISSDLKALHRDLMNSLRAAATASDHLAAAANSCRASTSSVERCQSPFTAASARLGTAYQDYLATRAKIGRQILDTETRLAEFRVAKR